MRPRASSPDYVFVNERGEPFGRMGIARKIEHAGEAAGLPFPIHVHTLRHSTGYALAAKGMDNAGCNTSWAMPAPIRFVTPQCRRNRSRTCGAKACGAATGAPLMRQSSGAHRNPPVADGQGFPWSFDSSLAAERRPLVGFARLDEPRTCDGTAFVIMDRSVIQQRLAETEEQIANGENQIAQQRRLIAELEIQWKPGFPCQIFASWFGAAANRSAG